MTQRYFTHFGMMVFVHALLLLGGVGFFKSELMQKDLVQKAIALNVGHGALSASFSAQKSAPASRSVVASPKPKLMKAKAAKVSSQAEVVSATSPGAGTAVTNGNGSSSGEGFGLTGTQRANLRDLYKAELRARIDEKKSYPAMSKRLGQQGEVVIAFTLLADGSLTKIRVTRPSSFSSLDQAALDAVKSVKKYRPIPEEFELAQMDVKVPIRFVTR